jgi:hypothetical protein
VAYSRQASTLEPAKRSIPVVSYRPTTGRSHQSELLKAKGNLKTNPVRP